MTIQIFDRDDQGYLYHIESNPNTYVLNALRNGRYLMIHRARCSHARTHSSERPEPFTGQQNIKICAAPEVLQSWVHEHHPENANEIKVCRCV